MDKRNLGLLAAFGATVIYGFNHTIAKNVMPIYIEAFGFVLLRVIGATLKMKKLKKRTGQESFFVLS